MKVTNVTSKKAALLVLTLFASFFILSQVAKKVDAQESVISQRPIYTDDVAQGWENWSWKSSVNFKNSNPTRTGEKSINYTSGAWGGLYFHNEQIRNIDGYKTFRFFLYPTKSGQDFRVLFFDKYNKKLNTEFTVSEYTDGLAPNKWTKVDIPLDKLKTETKEIKGVAIQEGKGINDSAIFIDDISFETQTETAPVSNSNSSTDSASNNYLIFENSLNSKWSDWSWGGRSSFTDLIEFKQTALWAAFYVHTKEQMDVSGYSTVNFSLKTEKTGNNYKIALFGADDMSFAEFKSLDKMGGQPGSTWKNYSIKISELNPSMRPIKGIAIHNGSEHTNISLFIDNISISGGTYFTLENQDSTTQPEPDKLPAPQQPTPDQAPASSEGTYKASKNVIYRNGSPVQLKGVSWFGFETSANVVHGLWQRNWKEMVTQIKNTGFNAVRVPFCPATLQGKTPTSIDYSKNDDLRGLNSLQIMDKVVKEINDQGMYILMDHHTPDCKTITSLWYTGSYSEQQWINDLKNVANRYKSLPYFMGMDIKNEPQGAATWGTGDVKTDWKIAAEKAGKEVLNANPNLLIFVQGVQDNPSCTSSTAHWWGGNLEPVACASVNNAYIPADKLVFSPHVYGPDVYWQSYFSASNFPSNMPAIWNPHFGYLADKGYTIVPGEWGGKYGNGGVSEDKVWQDAIVSYFKSKKICNSFYWDWNPNSSDTGGILQNDWKSVWQNKVNMLQNYYNSCK